MTRIAWVGVWMIAALSLQAATDQGAQAKIAESDTNTVVLRAVVGRATDQALLAKLASEGASIDKRIAAIEQMRDQKNLTTIVSAESLTTSDVAGAVPDGNCLRAGAVLRVEDKALVAKIKAGDPSGAVRFAAEIRLMDLDGKKIFVERSSAAVSSDAGKLVGAEHNGTVFASNVREKTGNVLTGDFANLTGKDRESVVEMLVNFGQLTPTPVGCFEVYNGVDIVGWTVPSGLEVINDLTQLKYAIIGRQICLREVSGGYCFLSVH